MSDKKMSMTDKAIDAGVKSQKETIMMAIDNMSDEEIARALNRAKRSYVYQVSTADADQLVTYCRWKAWCEAAVEKGAVVDKSDLEIRINRR